MDFSKDFDLGVGPWPEERWSRYQELIEDIREELAVDHYRGRPIPMEEQTRPTRWFDIRLRTQNERSVTVRFRGDNVYLVGYQMQDSNQWLEFTDENRRRQELIPGSISLGFGGSYSALAGAGGGSLDNVRVSWYSLERAVDNLAITTTGGERAGSLLVLIVMISESVRFTTLCDSIAECYGDDRTVCSIQNNMNRLIHSWGRLSAILRACREEPDQPHEIDEEDVGITTEDDIIENLGLIKSPKRDPPRRPRAADDTESSEVSAAGRGQGHPFVEIVAVRILDIDGEKPGDLYGTVTVEDARTCQYIYNRSRGDIEAIKPGDAITLVGPKSRCISAYDSFSIDFDLWDYDTVTWDDEISQGCVSWNIYDTASNVYNTLCTQEVRGKCGCAAVDYIVRSNAVQAVVDVTLENGDGEDPADVYGTITAFGREPWYKYFLFNREDTERIVVHPGEEIPLLRSAVAVQLGSSFAVGAKLYDHDRLSPDDEVADGEEEFHAQDSGVTEERTIRGRYGEIKVKITWTGI